ncbi:MAG: hypothetical protein AAF600_16925 [Bacteroidota bacterium]
MTTHQYSFFLIPLVFVFSSIDEILAQQQNSEVIINQWFDSFLGHETTGLYNGLQYQNNFLILNAKHQFFSENLFQSGNLIYDGQNYSDISLKYDIYQDNLIVKPRNAPESLSFQLVKSKVKKFGLAGAVFVHSDFWTTEKSAQNLGFCQLVWEDGTFNILKKHYRRKKETTKNNKVFHEFEEKEEYFIIKDGFLKKCNRSIDWITVFPDYKSKINGFFKSYKLLKKNDSLTFMENLSKMISELNQVPEMTK